MDVDIDELLYGRAALLGFTASGRVSAGGSCRLLRSSDGWVAINLARTSDLEVLPAVLQADVDLRDPWPAVTELTSARTAADVVARFQLLGVAAAMLDDPTVVASAAVTRHHVGRRRSPRTDALVVDLSSMWAGPLCARLLGLAGLHVCKVESLDRPDGARTGDPRFFAWLHDDHEMTTLDFRTASGREQLERLVARADVVIEASRPRALRQLGIDAEAVVAGRPGQVWVSITGYGRVGDAANKIAFGDDAAVAGGLVGRDEDGLPVFCGDAIADPLSGLVAATAAIRSRMDGGGELVEVQMAAVAKSLVTRTGVAARSG